MDGAIAEAFKRVWSEGRNRIAIYGLSEGRTRTFDNLREDIDQLLRALRRLHTATRPTIVSNVGNRVGFVPLFAASFELRAGFLPMDGDAAPREVFELADAFSADLIVVPANAASFQQMDPVPLPCGLAAIVRDSLGAAPWRTPNETGALLLKVTSGSSGAAKIVIAQEQNVVSDGLHVVEAMDIGPGDIGAACVPMAHSYGMGNLVLPLLLAGSSIVLRDRFVHAQWSKDVSQVGLSMFPGVPYIYDYFRRIGDEAASIASIRLLVTAGAPIAADTLRFFKERFGVKVRSLYGTTETGSITFDNSDELHEPVSVGWPMPGTTVTLMGTPDLQALGGRIRVQGDAVACRYAHDDPDEPRMSAFTPDGFVTADLGVVADDGRLTLLGRISEFVNVGGRKVHPVEVERVIAEMPDVVQVQVVGVANGARGQDLVACVQRRGADLTVALIRAHCAAVLAPHKVPRRVVFAEELPTDWRGKTDRRVLEEFLRTSAPKNDAV
jgi:long-chain acyl-CoA synthetase